MNPAEGRKSLASRYRSHTCGELGTTHVGASVKLSGWIHSKRDHGGVLFIDLRDNYGVTQLVSSDQEDRLNKFPVEEYNELSSLPCETVITVEGVVVERSPETTNNNIPTGAVEIIITAFNVESLSEPLPLTVNNAQHYPDDIRLQYRFLDLRRDGMRKKILLRSAVIKYIRERMHELGFSEFQTPILTATSPEGARDFVVPSRLHPGKFYALPQAPQQFKQLLMVAGFDRYFQIAPCFRDEDSRADRAPGEFYQLDVEMSFVTQEDIFRTMEPVIYDVFRKFSVCEIPSYPFPQIKYEDAMLLYGSDKPDLRNPIKIGDVSEIFVNSDFTIFRDAVQKEWVVRAIPAPKAGKEPRSFFDKMLLFAQVELGMKGLAYITFDEDGLAKGPIVKFLTPEQLQMLCQELQLQKGDAVFFVCERKSVATKAAGRIREKLGLDLNLIKTGVYEFCWITDFPFFEWDDHEKRIDFGHNPFSMPQGGLETLEAADSLEKQLKIKAFQYDIVCNGIELSSGAIRNHKPDIMYKAFSIVGYSKEDVDKKFGALISAFKYGAPPHGGIAPGIDRIIMLLANEVNIREIIAFPLNQRGQDLLLDAPREIDRNLMKELGISIVEKKSG